MSSENSNTDTTASNTVPVQQQQQQPQQETQTSSLPVQTQGVSQENISKIAAAAMPTRLADLETELKEMEAMTESVPLTKMPAPFRTKYLKMMESIETKRDELRSHVNYLVENKLISEKDASPFLGVISDSTADLDSKRPIFSFVEASYDGFKRSQTDSQMKIKRLEDHNRLLKDEKAAAEDEYAQMKKKMRTNDYAPTEAKQQQQMQSFEKPLIQKNSTSSLMDTLNMTSSNARNVPIDMHAAGLFDYDMHRKLQADERVVKGFNRVTDLMKSFIV